VVEGWFEDTLASGLPERLAFAYLDSDFHHSILVSLQHVYPRLSLNAVVCIDDYCDLNRNKRAWPGLPGVRAAVDEFMRGVPEGLSVLVGTGSLSLAMFRKLPCAL